MSAADYAAEIAAAYAEAGSILGPPHSLYRPTSALVAALAPANLLLTLPFISSATPDGSFRRPSTFDQDLRYGLFDTRLATPVIPADDGPFLLIDGDTGTLTPSTPVRAGDYIDGPTGTYFVASVYALEPPMVVTCNVVIRAARASGISPGLNLVYGGRTTATDQPELVDWPASIRTGGNSEAGRAGLPGDPKRFSGAVCKIPAIPGYTFHFGDRIMVNGGDTWMVAGAILQDQGWQLTLSSIEA